MSFPPCALCESSLVSHYNFGRKIQMVQRRLFSADISELPFVCFSWPNIFDHSGWTEETSQQRICGGWGWKPLVAAYTGLLFPFSVNLIMQTTDFVIVVFRKFVIVEMGTFLAPCTYEWALSTRFLLCWKNCPALASAGWEQARGHLFTSRVPRMVVCYGENRS